MEKKDVLVIVGDGLQGVQQLPDGDLKSQIKSLFDKVVELLEENFEIEKVESIAKQLTISVLEALNFKDLDLLKEAVLVVDREIESLKQR